MGAVEMWVVLSKLDLERFKRKPDEMQLHQYNLCGNLAERAEEILRNGGRWENYCAASLVLDERHFALTYDGQKVRPTLLQSDGPIQPQDEFRSLDDAVFRRYFPLIIG